MKKAVLFVFILWASTLCGFSQLPAQTISSAFKGDIYNPGTLKPTDSRLKVKVGDKAPDFELIKAEAKSA